LLNTRKYLQKLAEPKQDAADADAGSGGEENNV